MGDDTKNFGTELSAADAAKPVSAKRSKGRLAKATGDRPVPKDTAGRRFIFIVAGCVLLGIANFSQMQASPLREASPEAETATMHWNNPNISFFDRWFCTGAQRSPSCKTEIELTPQWETNRRNFHFGSVSEWYKRHRMPIPQYKPDGVIRQGVELGSRVRVGRNDS